MSVPTPQKPRRRKRLIALFVLILLAGGTALFLGLEFRPRWYRPAQLSEDQLQNARMETMALVDVISDRLVHREECEIAITDEQANTWLAGMASIWPEAARKIPTEVVEPVVRFEDGFVRIGARAESKGWRAIVSSDIELKVSRDGKFVTARHVLTRCGAVPIPEFIARRIWDPQLRRLAQKHQNVDDLIDGIATENRFVWPNGKRLYRIRSIHVGRGKLELTIEAL